MIIINYNGPVLRSLIIFNISSVSTEVKCHYAVAVEICTVLQRKVKTDYQKMSDANDALWADDDYMRYSDGCCGWCIQSCTY